ncbi:MAG: hypothetical protein ACTSPQ_18515 [Candidatus Helarchaeota archaeon]
MRNKAYLFGPFFGELSWEYFRFAPYAIYLKRISPDIKMIVLTRPERFDLYGQYADILIPQRVTETGFKQSGFKLLKYPDSIYENLVLDFKVQYAKKFDIIDHFYPDIVGWRYKVKWQFPRDKMDYNFIPRKKNAEFVKEYIGEKNSIILSHRKYDYRDSKYEMINFRDFNEDVSDKIDNKNITKLGCLIELIKRSDFVASTLQQDMGRLALLCQKPLIYLNRRVKNDDVRLMNPFDIPVIDCRSIQEGVEIYENNF